MTDEREQFLDVLCMLDEAVKTKRALETGEVEEMIRTIALLKHQLDDMTARHDSCRDMLRLSMAEVERQRRNYTELMQDKGVVEAVTTFAVGQYTRNRHQDG